MKKYLQILSALGALGALILFKQSNGLNFLSNVSNVDANSSNSSSGQNSSSGNVRYKDGTYKGSLEDAYYGSVQVQAIISNNKISDITFLQYPNDNPTSESINLQAMPILISEAIQAQSANVNGISGASATSPAFIASLTDALNQAK